MSYSGLQLADVRGRGSQRKSRDMEISSRSRSLRRISRLGLTNGLKLDESTFLSFFNDCTSLFAYCASGCDNEWTLLFRHETSDVKRCSIYSKLNMSCCMDITCCMLH